MTSKLRFTKKKKESPPKKKKKSSPTKKKEIEPAKKEMTLSTGKKKRGRSSSAEEHEAGGGSRRLNLAARLTSNRNLKNLQPNPAAASASPTQPDNEETPIVPPATSEDPPPTKRQNPSHQQDPPDASISRSSTKAGHLSEQGDNEEMGSHGEPTRSREPNATEEQIMVKEMAGGAIKPHKFYFKPAEYGKPLLKENFREDVEEFDDSCPRMCKSRFLANGSSGYALSEIYEKLGETKEISNILKPTGSESDLSVEIFDDGLWDDVELGDDGDIDDPIVDGWNKIIIHDQVKILWEDLYKMDVKTRKIEHEPERICEELEGPRVCEETEAGCESLKTRVAQLEASMKVRDDIIGQLEARIKSMENDRNPRDRFGNMEDLFDHDRFDTGGGQENESKVDADKEATKEGDNELEEMAEDDADKEATEDGENEHEKDSHVDADKEATKEGDNELEEMAEDDTDKEATKEVENDPEHALQEDLEVMVAAAEKFEKEVVEKKAAEKEVVEKKAWEKESTDEKDGDAEEDSPKKTKRVPKPSRMKQSPYVEK
ncbi:hypothetical protein Bca52824_058353 [Brassica carinata]|uniref:DUF287 domain-containing protein n=1 Tax=Brassica carinata TaxID=52824 RepID=A0A8X7QSM3_BRACI|nr:hypothetical protein Bca52824_058353 [Brassica carinata]